MDTGILAAVGLNAKNNDIDVETIQRLLNRVPFPVGSPSPLLAEDGDCGPLTIAAIRGFQQRALAFNDGVVDPFKKTHNKLIELAGSAVLPPSRTDLAEGILPLVQSILTETVEILEVLRLNPQAPGRKADIAREALKVHFLLDDGRDDHIGRVGHIFNSVNVDIVHRNIFWRDATMKQAKIELNERVSAKVPAIYFNFNTRASVVFTPNYKPFDSDGMGFGPQMLGYTLIVGLTKRQLGHAFAKPLLHSDTPGFPGPDFETAQQNAAAYGSFAFHMRLGFAQPMGEVRRNF